MIGSAAARHLAEDGVSTALIEPTEPVDRQGSAGPFSSHPDAGRITRVFDRSPVWSTLAARSIDRYGDIESRSGIGFYNNSGVVAAFEDVQTWIDGAGENRLDVRIVAADWLRSTTGIQVAEGLQVAYESFPGGHINPRRLVAAQTKLTAAAGGLVIEGVATALHREEGGLAISGIWGRVTARRVLVATGSFGAELLDVERYGRTTLRAEISGTGDLPNLIGVAPDPRLEDMYWVPPVRYPDGCVRLKIGGDMKNSLVLAPEELVDWFHSDGDADEIDALESSLRSLLPDAQLSNMIHAPCVTTNTATGLPYIGWVDDDIAVAIGGNGCAAKSSDELGRLASSLFSEQGWTDTLDMELFGPRTG